MNRPTNLQKVIAQIHKNVYSKKYECLVPNCTNCSINSHLLQRNGILNTISEEGHLIEYGASDLLKWSQESKSLKFRKLGLKKIVSLPLFCGEHDTSIFKQIETEPLDLTMYRSQLLFSYRTLCSEVRKKERNKIFFERVLNANSIKGEIPPLAKIEFETFLEGTKRGLKDFEKYKTLFEEEIHNEKGTFNFQTIHFPLIKICGSAVFSPIDYSSDNPFKDLPLYSIFIQVIPRATNLIIIIGYHKDYVSDWMKEYINSWQGLEGESLERKLTNLLATRIETWAMSPKLFNNIPKLVLEQFEEYWENNAMNLSQDQEINFNIFEGQNYGI